LPRFSANKAILEAAMYYTGIAYLLWFLSGFGALGFHRFYLGKIPTGVLWMCTGGLAMAGSVYDFFTLPDQVRAVNIRNAVYNGWAYGNRGRWRYVNDGEVHRVRKKETVERTILRLAKENNGIITATEVALTANLSMDDAKKALDALVSKGFAELRVRTSGTLVYTLPEMMDRDEPLEDF
jgi:TM2 domain-containing membrane protein YozV/predicted transcriptional regulator